MKRPAFMFFPGDWQRDSALGSCSASARGVLVETLCLMHQAEPYGHLLINGNIPTLAMIARAGRLSLREVRTGMSELEEAGVLRRTEDGAIYSARMVRDEASRQAKAAAGVLGGPHGSKSQDHPNASRPGDARGGGRPPKPRTEPPSYYNGKHPTGTRLEPPLSHSVSPSVSSPNVDDVVEKLIGLGLSGLQAVTIVAETNPSADYVDRWDAWIKMPSWWAKNPIGIVHDFMLARVEPPADPPNSEYDSPAPITPEQRERFGAEALRRAFARRPNLTPDSRSLPDAVDRELREMIATEQVTS